MPGFRASQTISALDSPISGTETWDHNYPFFFFFIFILDCFTSVDTSTNFSSPCIRNALPSKIAIKQKMGVNPTGIHPAQLLSSVPLFKSQETRPFKTQQTLYVGALPFRAGE